jgi:hypothetical protein
MGTSTSQPRSCRQCRYDGGLLPQNSINSFCLHLQLPPVVEQPKNGCAYWTPKPDTDKRR